MFSTSKPKTAELAPLWDSLERRLKRMAGLLSAAEELHDGIVRDFAELLAAPGASPAAMLRLRRPTRSSAPAADEQQRILRAQASQGAITVRIEAQPDGSSLAQLDGRSSVLLPLMLANLLEILIADNGTSHDHLVSWKSMSEISQAMAKRTGKQLKKHAVTELVFRLRQRLTKSNESKFFVLHHPQLGYRFALRRSAGPVTGRDHR